MGVASQKPGFLARVMLAPKGVGSLFRPNRSSHSGFVPEKDSRPLRTGHFGRTPPLSESRARTPQAVDQIGCVTVHLARLPDDETLERVEIIDGTVTACRLPSVGGDRPLDQFH